MSYQYTFERLDVWKDARMFVKEIYQTTRVFPAEEKFSLSSQIQRAVVSIVSNIAEGTSRISNKEKVRFLEIAYGSLMEVYCQLCVAFDLNYIDNISLEQRKIMIDKIANKLNALIRSLNEK